VDRRQQGPRHRRKAERARLSELRRAEPDAYLAALKASDPEAWYRELIVFAGHSPVRYADALRAENQRRDQVAAEKAKLAAAKAAKAERVEASAFCTDQVAAYVAATELVRDRLRAPATADFPIYTAARIKHGVDCTVTVSAFVDAENGFGATLRMDWTATIQGEPKRKRWQLVDVEIAGR
jgi:hypothetical protein